MHESKSLCDDISNESFDSTFHQRKTSLVSVASSAVAFVVVADGDGDNDDRIYDWTPVSVVDEFPTDKSDTSAGAGAGAGVDTEADTVGYPKKSAALD